MHTKLSIPERLKDLRVVDKHLTLKQLAEQTGPVSYTHLDVYKRQIYIIPCPCFFFNKYPQLALRSSHSSKCSQVCRSMSCSKASCMVFSPENSRTTINFTFLLCLFSCFWVFSIGYLHRSEKPDKGHPATKSGNGLRKTCNLSSGHRFLLFKFSCEISLLSLSENKYPPKSLA